MKGFVKGLVFTKTLQSLLPWGDIHKWHLKFEIFLIRSFIRNHLQKFWLIRTHDWTCKFLMINIQGDQIGQFFANWATFGGSL
jgi:hypothetical protein